MISKKRTRRISAFVLAVVTLSTGALPVSAADGDAAPTYDEAYYATLDYYGNLTEGSIVKSYVMNGATSLTDYGTYDSMVNLTDATVPVTVSGKTTFTFDSNAAPSHFYFQGETAEPYEKLPWTLSLSYKLNGVPVRAEELAGQKGVVEITVDAIPNAKASSYTKHNYTLEAMALFNQDDILSLEAPGAQVQLIGNLRAVLFLALPGEEQHFTIRVGADSFTFDGMTFLMVPATLGQLEQVAELAQRKDDLEDNYQKLSDSLDTLLDSLDDVSSGLYDAAGGLDALNAARGTVSAGKGAVYSRADALRADLDTITAALSPVDGDLAAASETLASANETLGSLTVEVTGLRTQLDQLKGILENVQGNRTELLTAMDDLDAVRVRLNTLASSLDGITYTPITAPTVDVTPDLSGLDNANAVYSIWQDCTPMDGESFGAAVLRVSGQASSQAAAKAMWAQMVQISDSVTEQAAATLTQIAQQGADVTDEAVQAQVKQQVIAAVAEATGQTPETVMTACGLVQTVSSMGTYPSDFLGFLNALYALSPDESLATLIKLVSDNPNTMELIISGSDDILASANGISDDINASISGSIAQANAALSSVSALSTPTANLLSSLAVLCNDLGTLRPLVDTADEAAALGADSAEQLRSVLAQVDALYGAIDAYEPQLQQSIQTVSGLVSALTGTVVDMGAFSDALENLMQTSGVQLDAATRQSLSGLSSSLRSIADSLDTTESIRETKNSLNTIIEDTWTEHTGEFDTLLLMDATAEPVSLTDSRNGTPQSVQVMIRTQEIKPQTSAITLAANTSAVETQQTTFWQRVGEMFHGILAAVIGIFHKGEVVNNA